GRDLLHRPPRLPYAVGGDFLRGSDPDVGRSLHRLVGRTPQEIPGDSGDYRLRRDRGRVARTIPARGALPLATCNSARMGPSAWHLRIFRRLSDLLAAGPEFDRCGCPGRALGGARMSRGAFSIGAAALLASTCSGCVSGRELPMTTLAPKSDLADWIYHL